MKHTLFFAWICFLAIVLLLGAIPCGAGAEALFDGIVPSDVQGWIDRQLTENPGDGAEWYVLALSQYKEYDFSSYESALLAYLKDNTVSSASSNLKYALTLAAVGSTDGYIAKTLNDSIGKQGLMSWVFGLHLLNNRYKSDTYTVSDVTAKLLSLQCADGGWAITGQYGDVDATAMTVQALAPYCKTDGEVKTAVEKALSFLSAKQLDGGDYASYGVANPESTAQVLVALSSLGIDAKTDERFIKNGNDLFDGIETYKLPSGEFCHQEGGEANGHATVQTLCAMVSYLRLKDGKSPLYILDHADPEKARPAPTVPSNTPETDREEPTESTGAYKWWVSLILVGIGGFLCVLLFVLKKRHIKNYIAVLLVTAAALTLVCVTDFQSADEYYNGEDEVKENAIGTVSLTIRCDAVAGRAEHIPANGIILDVTEFAIAEGDTVYTILTEAARKHKIQLENDGNAKYAYISGINYLYELDYGDLSGWVYLVNGERVSVGAGEYKLKDGDVIEWHYSTNLGEDYEIV